MLHSEIQPVLTSKACNFYGVSCGSPHASDHFPDMTGRWGHDRPMPQNTSQMLPIAFERPSEAWEGINRWWNLQMLSPQIPVLLFLVFALLLRFFLNSFS